MLSELIPSIHSYPAVHLVAKPVDQRYVQSGPLVLGSTPLKCKRLQQIETNLSHAYISRPSLLMDWTIPPPFDKLRVNPTQGILNLTKGTNVLARFKNLTLIHKDQVSTGLYRKGFLFIHHRQAKQK
jgi:hypothetical protein